jgi:Tol biopolymer transport system component
VWRDAGSLSGPPGVSPTGQQLAVVVRRDENRRLVVMSTDGTGLRSMAPSVAITGAAGQSAADWSPDGTRIVAGGSDARGAALFVIPVAGGNPGRLVEGEAVNPIWSPDGRLIVYAGTFEAGQAPLLAVRPDGTRVVLPPVRVRPGGYRFMPDGASLVYLPRAQAADFWQLDLATGQSRQLTRLASRGALRTFDITPDGSHIVFDRSRENGDIVLIDVPR